jgi:isocitrate dehydrogenase
MEYHQKKLGTFTIFKNEDLEDCVRPICTSDIDPSIINLRNDPHKHICMYRKSKEDIVVSLDPKQDKILRLELIRFFEEDGGQGWFNARKIKED